MNTSREAVLNAVAHRDYSISGQVVFITASPDGFLIESPGGFLPGITPKNAIFSRAWRNQRLAEVFEKAGLIERHADPGTEIVWLLIGASTPQPVADWRSGRGSQPIYRSLSPVARIRAIHRPAWTVALPELTFCIFSSGV